ncbi:UDP-N-acetylmuramate--L-alanine ligase, partial [Vibrio sp. 10N.222.49.C9]
SLCRTIRSRGRIDPIFVKEQDDLPKVLANLLQEGDLVLTQGAGDVGKVAKRLEKLELNIRAMQKS